MSLLRDLCLRKRNALLQFFYIEVKGVYSILEGKLLGAGAGELALEFCYVALELRNLGVSLVYLCLER